MTIRTFCLISEYSYFKVQNLEQELRASKSNSNRNNNPVDSAYKSDYSEINGSAAFRIDSHRINALQDNIDDLMRASK